MIANFTSIQRAAVSIVGSLMLATVFVGTAVAPAEASIAITQPVR